MKLSEKLITLRKEKGWSQEEFAEKLDVSRQAVSRWENETALPDAQNLLRISKLFDVTADYLLNDTYEKESDVLTVSPTTEATEPLIQKKKHPYWPYAIGFIIMILGICAIVGVAISKNSSKSKEPHIHDVSIALKENEVAPTCMATGSYDEVIYCAVCNEEVLRTRRDTDMIAHTPSNSLKENEIAPTCTAKGSYDEVIYCAVCHAEVLRTHRSTEKIAHQFQNKKCILCDEAKPSEGLLFMSNRDGTCTVDGGTCTDENIVIPEYSPNGEKVVQIKPSAFFGRKDVKSVQIPETVTVIGESAFQDCTNLESVNLPSNITKIASCTFYGCENLKDITIPSGVTHIGYKAFANCRACESIVIPASVIKIESFAFMSFSNCDGTFNGTIVFEINDGWELYDSSGSLVNILDLQNAKFKPIMYIAFMHSEYTWKQNQ